MKSVVYKVSPKSHSKTTNTYIGFIVYALAASPRINSIFYDRNKNTGKVNTDTRRREHFIRNDKF